MKQDAAGIRAYLDELAAAPWLGRGRADWPSHVYHFTDVHNVARILLDGRIYSRQRLAELRRGHVDIANQEIIQQSPWAHRYARLYFGPKTPTQYRMEGIRPVASRLHGAHCPVPVFLIFDSRELLTREGCWFSDGNIARPSHRLGNGEVFLRSLDFRSIYHRGQIGPNERKDHIVFSRNAEVLFKDELDLSSLREVVCRTGAERETLLHLLGEGASTWREKIRIERPGENLFYRQGWYVREVQLIDNEVFITLNQPCYRHERELLVRTRDGQERRFMTVESLGPATQERFVLASAEPRVFVQFRLMGAVAYQGYLTQRSLY